MSRKRTRWLKFSLLLAVPVILYLVTAERLSWRPRSMEAGASVLTVAFAPDGRTLASGNFEGVIHLWNTRTGQLLHTLKA
ncbi:MAG: hypothetical protein M3347_15425, partial [Armatimonadota bacterium]|nr:hypothetical protein [Armatimonadota bacterium]